MTEVSFYHLQLWPLEKALPKLLERTLQAGKRAVVMVASEARVEQLNNLLWTYEQDSWLPHGTAKDGRPEDQPVWLTVVDEAPNGAAFLFLTEGAGSQRIGEFERCFELFDGNDEGSVAVARKRWKKYKEAGYGLKYLQQDEAGGWREKATA